MSSKKNENPMRRIYIEKVTLNICVGQDEDKLLKAKKLLEKMTGMKPCPCKAKRTIRDFGITKKKVIAYKVTLRGEKAVEFLKRALHAVDYTLKESQFDEFGNFSFGVPEYMDIQGVKYDHEIGMLGLDVCVSLARPGWRVKYRKRCKSKIGKSHRITKEEAIEWVKNTLGVNVVSE